MDQRFRIRFVGGMILATGVGLVIASILYTIVSRDLRFLLLLLSAAGWVSGGYLMLRAVRYTGMRVAGFTVLGLAIAALTSYLGSLLTELAGL